MTGRAPDVDAGVPARRVSRIALDRAPPLRAGSTTVLDGRTRGAARAAVVRVSPNVDAARTTAGQRGSAAYFADALTACRAPVQGNGARGVAAAAMLQVGRDIDAGGATIRRTHRAGVRALAIRANRADRAGATALTAMGRVAAEFDAVFSAARERRNAGCLAAPGVAEHRGAGARLTSLATAAAVQFIRARVDAAVTARPGFARTGEGAAAIHTHRR